MATTNAVRSLVLYNTAVTGVVLGLVGYQTYQQNQFQQQQLKFNRTVLQDGVKVPRFDAMMDFTDEVADLSARGAKGKLNDVPNEEQDKIVTDLAAQLSTFLPKTGKHAELFVEMLKQKAVES